MVTAGRCAVRRAPHVHTDPVSEVIDRVERNRRAFDLEAALASNRRSGQAIGIVTASHRLTSEQAFDVLRQYSTRRNVKLAAVAEDVVHTGGLPRIQRGR